MRGGCSSNNPRVGKEVEKRNLRWRVAGGEGGAEREKGCDWLEEDRRVKKERGTERIEAGREK